MRKNGFAFIETIISVVILSITLLLLYTVFNKTLQTEKTRIYYDDINYIYRTWYLKEQMTNLNFEPIKNDFLSNNKYYMTIGLDTANILDDYTNKNAFLHSLINEFEVEHMIIVKSNKLTNIKNCTKECANNPSCENYSKCNDLYNMLSSDMIVYLQTLYIDKGGDIDGTYGDILFVCEYNSCNDSDNCKKFYSWVSV